MTLEQACINLDFAKHLESISDASFDIRAASYYVMGYKPYGWVEPSRMDSAEHDKIGIALMGLTLEEWRSFYSYLEYVDVPAFMTEEEIIEFAPWDVVTKHMAAERLREIVYSYCPLLKGY